MGHIELARWAQLVLIAPASADFIARLAGGRADDLLDDAVPRHRGADRDRPRHESGHVGEQGDAGQRRHARSRAACASSGPPPAIRRAARSAPGRMWEPNSARGEPPRAAGQCRPARPASIVLITAGPTRERLDPVRYLTNRSSGKMGFAIAAAAREAGAHVTLVTGPVQLPTPGGRDAHQRGERARDVRRRSSPHRRGGRIHRRRGRRRLSAGEQSPSRRSRKTAAR